jgi:hypothetical protein
MTSDRADYSVFAAPPPHPELKRPRADQDESRWHRLSGLVVARRARRMAAVDEQHVHEGRAMVAVPRST